MDTYLVHREVFPLCADNCIYYNFKAMISLRKDVMAFLCDKRMPSVASLFANRWLSERSSSGLVREMSVASSRSQPTRFLEVKFETKR